MPSLKIARFAGRKTRARRAAAAVEFAVVAPIMVMIAVGSIELGRSMMVLDLLNNAARLGCRMGVLPGNGNSDITTAVTNALSDTGVQGAAAPVIEVLPQGTSNWVNPGDAGSAVQGDTVRVTVSVAYKNVSWLGFNWFMSSGATLSGKIAMTKE
jgi:Flp pilus assembly protein TadG